jgi:DNA invertase Pin-like site-specific DNA recombinase
MYIINIPRTPSTGMQIKYLIAVFALAAVVCGDVFTRHADSAEATSRQTRRLHSEINILRIRRPVDNIISSDDTSISAAGGDQAPPIRSSKRKQIPVDIEYASEILVSLKHARNADDTAPSLETASSPETRPFREKHKGQLNLNEGNVYEIAGVSSIPRKTFKKSSDQERQEIVHYLRQRMNADGSLHYGSINHAVRHFGRHKSTISKIYKELIPKSASERDVTENERKEIVHYLRQRINADGRAPYGTNIEAAKHFGKHESTISRIYKELKQKSEITKEQERQDITLFLRQRMNAYGSLPYGTINEAAIHFGRSRSTISRISQKMIPKYAIEHGALLDAKTIVRT